MDFKFNKVSLKSVKRSIVPLSLILTMVLPLPASAIIYQPGDTLDPQCSPANLATCNVAVSGSATSSSNLATTTVTQFTATGNTTLNNASTTNLTVSGNTVLGNTTLSNATSTNFFSTALAAATATFTNLIASIANIDTLTARLANIGSITATSSLTSNGTLAVTGTTSLHVLDMNTTRIIGLDTPVGVNDAANKSYVDGKFQGVSWQSPVISFATSTTVLATSTGSRYIIAHSIPATAASCTIGGVAEYNGSSWSCLAPSAGWSTYVNNESTSYNYNGVNWVSLGSTVNHSQLSSLQGGNGSTEMYHLNLADFTALHPGNSNAQLSALQVIGAPSFAGLTITSSTTRADAFNVTGTSTMTGNTTVSGALTTNTANVIATTTTNGLVATLANIVNAVISSITGGSITATSSLTSNGTLTVAGTSTLATTTIADLTATNLHINGLTAPAVTAGTITATSSLVAATSSLATTTVSGTLAVTGDTTIANATSTNFFASILNAITSTINTLTGGSITATSSLTSNGTLAVTGTSTLATTTVTDLTANNLNINGLTTGGVTAGTITSTSSFVAATSTLATTTVSKLTVTGDTVLANATSTNFFSSVLASITGLFNTLTGGNITATSSLTSNGTLAVTGTSTLATTTASGLTISQNGLTFASSTPASIANTLYRQGGNLFFGSNQLATANSGTSVGNTLLWNGSTWAENTLLTLSTSTNVLNINGLASTTAITATATSSFASLLTTGRVGVGTLNPTEMLHVQGNAFVSGNLTVMGTSTTVNVANLAVADKNVYLASSTNPTDAVADGGGMILKGTTNKSILWVNSTNVWDFSHGASIRGVASSTGLVVNGSATTTGTLSVSGTSTLATTTISTLRVTGASTLATSTFSGFVTLSSLESQKAANPYSNLVIGSDGVVRYAPSVNVLTDVLDNNLATPPVSPIAGDAYLLSTTTATFTGAWAGATSSIATWNGSSWNFYTPTTNDRTSVTTGINAGNVYTYSGTAWTSTSVSPSTNWVMGGNTFTGTAVQKIGTLTKNDFAFIASTTERMRLTAAGMLGLGTSTPNALLTINSASSSQTLLSVATSTNSSIFTIASNGNVGIGTTAPSAKLEIANVGTGLSFVSQGAVAFKKGNDFATTTAFANDVNFGNASLIRINQSAGPVSITGIANGTDGQILTLMNASSTSIVTLVNATTSSIASNRIITGTGGDLTLAGDASVLVVYDASASKWRVVGGSGGSGGSQTTVASITASSTQTVWGNTITANAATASLTVTLPTAVGNSGKSTEIVKTDNTTNTVIVDAFGTQTINGSTNPIYLYGQGDSVVLRSDGANVQIVSDNRSSVGQSKGYIQTTISAAQITNVSGGDHVKFDTITNQYGSDISLDTSTAYSSTAAAASVGRFTLKAGKTYRLVFHLGEAQLSSASDVAFAWYDATSGTMISSSPSDAIPTPQTGNFVSDSVSDAVFTPTVDTKVELRLIGTTMTSIGFSGRLPSAYIEVLSTPQNTISTVDYGIVRYTGADTGPLTANQLVSFDSTLQAGNMAYSGSQFTLIAGKTYELESQIAIYNTAGTSAGRFEFYNYTDSASLPNAKALEIAIDGTPGTHVNQAGILKTIYTPTKNVQIGVRALSFYGVANPGVVGSAGSGTDGAAGSTYFKVTQIGTTGYTGLPFNYIGQALAAGSLDNTNFNQDWNWSTLTTTNGLDLTANALTTGSLLTLTSSSTALASTNGLLYVANTGASTNGVVAKIQANSTAGSGLTVLANGNVGIGIATPGFAFDMRSASTTGATAQIYNTSAAGTVLKLNTNSGSTGTQFLQFQQGGTGVIGTVTINTPGTSVAYNTTSDRRIKENIATSTLGLANLLQIPVRDYNYIADTSKTKQTGFIAQDLEKIFPGAVTVNGDDGVTPLNASSTPWMVDYGRVTPLIVKGVQDFYVEYSTTNIAIFGTSTDAITFATSTFPNGIAPALAALASSTDAQMKSLASSTSITAESLASLASSTALTVGATGEKTFVGAFFDRLIAWLGDATNGIQTIVANVFKAKEVQTDKLCVGTTCITADQFMKLINGQGQSSSTNSGTQSAPTSTVPGASLILNGDSIIGLTLGATWTDTLGANYNHDGFVDVIHSTSTVDTSVVGTTTIDYFATYISAASSTISQILHITRAIVVTDPNATTTATSTSSSSSTASSTPTDTASTTTSTTPAVDTTASSTTSTDTATTTPAPATPAPTPLTCTAPQVLNTAGDTCVDPAPAPVVVPAVDPTPAPVVEPATTTPSN